MTIPAEQIGRTIQLFLVDGAPNGLVVASIHGWTATVLVATQSTFGRLLSRPEVDRAGIYILFGPDPGDALSTRAYIGEADSVRDRLARSAAERAFWEIAVVVTTTDEALSKGHIRYLEARLIELARAADRAKLDNGQEPSSSRKRLPEADRANMEAFLANLKVILPVVGVDFLKPRPKATQVGPAAAMALPEEAQFEIRHKSGVKAFAVEEDGEFVVLEGSEALRDADYEGSRSYAELKLELIAQGVLVAVPGQDIFRFTRSYEFRSPSAAAAIVLDRNSNGRTEWKVLGSKSTYHDWQEERSQGSSVTSDKFGWSAATGGLVMITPEMIAETRVEIRAKIDEIEATAIRAAALAAWSANDMPALHDILVQCGAYSETEARSQFVILKCQS